MVTPIIYDHAWSRQQIWDEAKRFIHEQHKARKVAFNYTLIPHAPPGGRKYGTGGTHFGMFSPTQFPKVLRIWVNVQRSTMPQMHRGRVWSWPGHKTDRTAIGIYAHEYGHLVEFTLKTQRKLEPREWSLIAKRTKPVSGYEPNWQESWAESFRIFLLNPNLLRQARVERYEYIAHRYPPVHDLEWQAVLRNAPPHIIAAATNFIKEGTLQKRLI